MVDIFKYVRDRKAVKVTKSDQFVWLCINDDVGCFEVFKTEEDAIRFKNSKVYDFAYKVIKRNLIENVEKK